MRFAADTGGTFTDLVVGYPDGSLSLYKAPTTPSNPVEGLLDVFEVAASDVGISRAELLSRGTELVYGTTRSINAVVTGTTARTAFLTTEGHPDILLLREGGRSRPFDYSQRFPAPYVPRRLTFEVPGRIDAAGREVRPLDERAVGEIARELAAEGVEAVGVCLLWSIVNAQHELRVAELLQAELPDVALTLSHRLNPSIREYRRASSTCIDASLKPLMQDHLATLEERVREAGFTGELLMSTSAGGVRPVSEVAEAPILTLNSGPSMAPLAGRHYAALESKADTAIIADTGGTTYDVSLVRNARISRTRDTWLGPQWTGHITGFPSVDVRSIGAGGGSIARVDEGGRLHVGPESAGAVPGPASYGRGGSHPTVTDACVALGYIDPDYFAGGLMQLDVEAARAAIERDVAVPLGRSVEASAAAILEVITEHMVRAIEEVTVRQGIDPRSGVLVGGGGAAGLNAVAIARRLGCRELIIPDVAAALSAVGGLMSDITRDYAVTFNVNTGRFDYEGVAATIAALREQASLPDAPDHRTKAELSVEARYPHQVWDIELPLPGVDFDGADAVSRVRDAFHDLHQELFAVSDRESEVEILTWRLRAERALHEGEVGRLRAPDETPPTRSRQVYFESTGPVDARVVGFADIPADELVEGPAIIESPVTTVVIDPGAAARSTEHGSLVVSIAATATAETETRMAVAQ